MISKKISKKALQSLLTDSMHVALGALELPEPTKKVNKLIDKSSRKLASEFASILKKEMRKEKKNQKSLTYVDDVLKGKKTRKNKETKLQPVESI